MSTFYDDYDEAVEKKPPAEESYEVSEEEMLSLRLLMAELRTAQAEAKFAQQTLDVYRNNVAGKYSEYGKYTLIGEIDQATRQGKRILAE